MKTPPTYVAFRLVAVTLTVLVLLVFGLGLGGLGPLEGLGVVAKHAVSWLHANTGVIPR
jgi:hypothetical protein